MGRSTTQSTMVDVVGMIKECGLKLDAWNMTTFGHVQKKLQQAKQQLNQLYEGDCGSDVSVLNKAKEEVQLWLEKDEVMWRQRSKALWLKEGDHNSRYFHMKASQRSRKNRLVQIQDDKGQWQEGSSKEKVILDYFRDLFTSTNLNAFLDFLTVLRGKVTFHMNEALCREYTEVEVKDTLQQIHPSKAPRPDGMSPIFFQKYWHVVGRSVTAAILHALNSVAKVLANRLKMVLNDIIGETQSAFVPGRLITDNVLIAYEIMHYLKLKKKGKKGFMSLKLDMSKTYDRVEWGFLKTIMEVMGFNQGLPPIVGRSRANAFRSIKQRAWQKLQAWKEKLLSQGGKEVLLKVVTLSIPSYSMSCFLLPSSLCAELENTMARFWWGQRKDERIIHWLSWDNMFVRKASGRLGFKNLRVFNLAMLATQGWHLLKEENSLLHKLLKAKYFSGSDFLQAGLGRSLSYTWRGIWKAKKWVLEGCRWRIGVGITVNIWFDNWILGHNALVKEGYVVNEGNHNECVNSLMCENSRPWDFGKLRALFNQRVVEDIQKIVLCDGNGANRRIWGHDRNGVFSVRSCYKFIVAQQTSQVAESSSSCVQSVV
ncbi:hypothetical protein Pint_10775 [Pistacia integerrima]|uniref:Uncharacterized protein n=1 Tax=Pistacia integerrima TaxID=434235 RepID=A0ACC0XIF0_9ROSI|nr:hypothetical protein Pint_10775 [Pistacia integerrima]